MRKIQVFLREEQKAALEALSERTGQRQSDLVRQGVDLLLRDTSGQAGDWRDATRALAGLWRDRDDLGQFSQTLRESARKRFPGVYGT